MRKTRDNLLFIIIAFVLITVGGCRQHDDDDPTVVRMGAGDFNITLSAEPYPENTKISQFAPAAIPLEDAIFNLHVFLIPLHTNAGTGPSSFDTDARHYYFEFDNPYMPGQIKLDRVFFGKYKIYLLANNGKNIRDKDYAIVDDPSTLIKQEQVESITLDDIGNPHELNLENKVGIPMHYSEEALFAQQPAIEMAFALKRLMSKVYIDKLEINTPSDPLNPLEFELKTGWSIINVPQTTQPFNPDYVATKFFDACPIDTRSEPAYILANPQKEALHNASSVFDRTQFFAPKKASYIFLEGFTKKANKQEDYGFSVYLGNLGEEGSEDWDNYIVDPNQQYPVNFHFKDMSKITDDPRISQTSVEIIKDKNDYSENMNLSRDAEYTIEFSLIYTNVYHEYIALYPEISMANAPDGFDNSHSFKITETLNNLEVEKNNRDNYIINIEDTDGKGSIDFKIVHKYTVQGLSKEGSIAYTFSNSRGRIQSFRYDPVKFK